MVHEVTDYMKKVKDGTVDNKAGSLIIRKARIGDVKKVHKILSAYTTEGTVLPRSLSELYDQLRDFFFSVAGPSVSSIAT